MRVAIAVCACALAVGCEGGDGGSNGAPSSCLPSCLQGFAATCMPAGECVHQTDPTTGITNLCWENGVSQILSMSVNPAITVKNSDGVCYSLSFDPSGAWSLSDPSGRVVATLAASSGRDGYTVTCSGGQPQSLDAACARTSPVLVMQEASSGDNCSVEGDCGL